MSKQPGMPNWDVRYDSDTYVFGTEPNDFLKSVAEQIKPNSKVLCLADGEGRNGVYLAEQGHQVTAIDQSQVGLDKAQQLAQKRGVKLATTVADLSDYDLGRECWDCIVSIFFHIPPVLQKVIYPRVIDALKPGGLLILESYTPKQLEFKTGGPPVAENMLTADQASAAFAALDIQLCTELEREVIEGVGHTGHAAVLQFMGVKIA